MDSTSQALFWINARRSEFDATLFWQRDDASRMYHAGSSAEVIAQKLDLLPEDIRSWIEEFKEEDAQARKRWERQFIKVCDHCGQDIELGMEFIPENGKTYHKDCWRKRTFGFSG